jgi:hypothetical protein
MLLDVKKHRESGARGELQPQELHTLVTTKAIFLLGSHPLWADALLDMVKLSWQFCITTTTPTLILFFPLLPTSSWTQHSFGPAWPADHITA